MGLPARRRRSRPFLKGRLNREWTRMNANRERGRGRIQNRSVKIGAAHEVVTARATEFAFLIVQLVAATRTPTPMFAFGSAIERDSAFGGVNRLVVGGG